MKDFLLNSHDELNFESIEELEHISSVVKEIADKMAATEEKILAEFLEENDIVCGSIKVKAELEQRFPKMKVLHSPYISENLVLAVKKKAYIIGN